MSVFGTGGRTPVRISAASAGQAGGTAFSVNRPANVLAGDILLAGLYLVRSAGTVPNEAWVGVRAVEGPVIAIPGTEPTKLYTYWRRATGSEPAAYGFTNGRETGWGGAILCYRGEVWPEAIEDDAGQQNAVAGTTHPTPGIRAPMHTQALGFFSNFLLGGLPNPFTSISGMAKVASVTGAPVNLDVFEKTYETTQDTGSLPATTPDPCVSLVVMLSLSVCDREGAFRKVFAGGFGR